jgi:hypothetical protein
MSRPSAASAVASKPSKLKLSFKTGSTGAVLTEADSQSEEGVWEY